MQMRQRVGEMADLRIAGDEHDVQVGRQQAMRPAQTVIGGVERLVPQPAAPYRDGLRGDAGVLLGDQQLVGEVDRAPGRRTEKIEDSDSHARPSRTAGQGSARTTISDADSDVTAGGSKRGDQTALYPEPAAKHPP